MNSPFRLTENLLFLASRGSKPLERYSKAKGTVNSLFEIQIRRKAEKQPYRTVSGDVKLFGTGEVTEVDSMVRTKPSRRIVGLSGRRNIRAIHGSGIAEAGFPQGQAPRRGNYLPVLISRDYENLPVAVAGIIAHSKAGPAGAFQAERSHHSGFVSGNHDDISGGNPAHGNGKSDTPVVRQNSEPGRNDSGGL